MDDPQYVTRPAFEERRGEREFACTIGGLWVSGSLEGLRRPCVAVVGTRAATPYGRRIATAFARDLASSGCCIISGLALGIDAAAHEGALTAGAPTIGVLGGGHACFFPRRNRDLAKRMIEGGGAVLSPYPPAHPPMPHQFLERNGVVAALADAIVVIEAPARSGALNTANWAAARIPVFAVPGDVDRAHVQGCLALIRDGAMLARHAGDVLEVLPLATRETARPHVTRDGVAGSLLEALGDGERELDDLVSASGHSVPEVLAALALLELEGLIERRDATRFARLI